MLSVALTCFYGNKKQQLFFPKGKKEKKEEKRDMPFKSHAAAAVKVFWKKILPGA
jgi:hypothetical protein